jgi:HPt (histidine-containing phosphotransfer) domain-containing protein
MRIAAMTTCQAADELYYSTLAAEPDLVELVALFVDELPGRLAALTDAASRGDWPAVGSLAHQLKGAGGSHGFAQITPYAWKLERSAREFRSGGEVTAALEQLIATCSRVRAGVPN